MPQALNTPGFLICRDKVIITLLLMLITNVNILEFLSAQFVNRGALFLARVST